MTPAAWSASAVPGEEIRAAFAIANSGPSELIAYADSRLIVGGEPVYADIVLYGTRGKLTPTTTGCRDWLFFPMPQRARSARVDVVWTSPGSVVDVTLWDPLFTAKASSAAVSAGGNSVSVTDPMSGYWSALLTLASDLSPMPPAGYRARFSCELPIPMAGFASSAPSDMPIVVAPGESGTITATFTVPPATEVSPGDVLTGRLDFYTVVDMVTCAGGDRLGSVPVTITVTE